VNELVADGIRVRDWGTLEDTQVSPLRTRGIDVPNGHKGITVRAVLVDAHEFEADLVLMLMKVIAEVPGAKVPSASPSIRERLIIGRR
jgi:hypothetical protein